MTTVRDIQLQANAGAPDSVLSRRIDVVEAAGKLYDAWNGRKKYADEFAWVIAVQMAQQAVIRAVSRYRGAMRNRHRSPTT